MTDTQFADISEFQVPVDDSYPWPFIAVRSNDGTYLDQHFGPNLAWCKAAVESGRIGGFIVYFVYWPNWAEGVAALKAHVGDPHPSMAVMIDVESWGGKIAGDQSAGANAAREDLIGWLGGNRQRVIGYANEGDFNNLWPSRGDAGVILANYVRNDDWPGKIAHQYANNFVTAPFGPCDINSADGFDLPALLAALGLPGGSGVVVPTPVPTPAPAPPAAPAPSDLGTRRQIDTVTVQSGDNLTAIAKRYPEADITAGSIAADNGIADANLINAGQVLAIRTGGAAPAAGDGCRQIDTVTVQSGDNLTAIAKRYAQADITAGSIAADNGIADPNVIYAGTVLAIKTAQ
jgi:LysM repeat protein